MVDRLNVFQDDSGNRHFITVEVENNLDAFHEVDMPQVFAQCYQDLQNPEKPFLSREEQRLLSYMNSHHLPQSMLESQLLNFFPRIINQFGA